MLLVLRTVRDGATDRSYGVHVADLAGVPAPVIERSHDVLDRLHEEKAIEAKGPGSETSPDETVQAVFDLGGGQLRDDATADGGAAPAALDPTTKSVRALRGVEVAGHAPVESLSRVQEQEAVSAGGVSWRYDSCSSSGPSEPRRR